MTLNKTCREVLTQMYRLIGFANPMSLSDEDLCRAAIFYSTPEKVKTAVHHGMIKPDGKEYRGQEMRYFLDTKGVAVLRKCWENGLIGGEPIPSKV